MIRNFNNMSVYKMAVYQHKHIPCNVIISVFALCLFFVRLFALFIYMFLMKKAIYCFIFHSYFVAEGMRTSPSVMLSTCYLIYCWPVVFVGTIFFNTFEKLCHKTKQHHKIKNTLHNHKLCVKKQKELN